MEPAAALPKVSFIKKLRKGQKRVIDELVPGRNKMNVKLPTGYGKTYTACCAYSVLKARGLVNRLLYIVSNDAQLDQFYKEAAEEFRLAGVDGPLKVVDVGFSSAEALKTHLRNECQIFVITIQSLREQRGANNVTQLLQQGQWMVCVDEYHHYGIEKSWGRAALALNRAFLLCMSATPYRLNDDSAFGIPDVLVTYREGREEEALKPLIGHSYNYRVDFDSSGETISITTKDLVEMAGGDSPDRIENFTIKRKMRWSPDYISPLVSNPIERMQMERLKTGFKLQTLVFAMCVSHAKLVCEQIAEAFPELVVDWVGTGEQYGRPDHENQNIRNRFCPKKIDGERPDSDIDVLVNVGIAGEGLDCVNVSEIVFLNSAGLNNRNLQICGRAARYLPGVEGHINFDASSEFAQRKYIGAAIVDAMDFIAPEVAPEDERGGDGDGEYEELPDEPFIRIWSMELIEIDSGDEGVQRMARVMEGARPNDFDYAGMKQTLDHPHWEQIKFLYHGMRKNEASEFNEKATIAQLRTDVDGAVGHIVGLAKIKLGINRDPLIVKKLGIAKRAINRRKMQLLGSCDGVNDEQLLRAHYGWVKQLERDILANGVPPWLAQMFK